MSQPKWKLIANLGDVNPVDHGGYFVYIDETGVYAPGAELLIVPEYGDVDYIVHRFILEPCTFVNGVLSDNPFRPAHPAWFANKLKELQEFSGQNDLINLFCSDQPIWRALAWRTVGEYFGFYNIDPYPTALTRAQAKQRYSQKGLK